MRNICFSIILLVPVGAQEAFAAIHIVDLSVIPPFPNQNIISGDTIVWSLDGVTTTGCTPLLSNTFNVNFFIGGGPTDTAQCIAVVYNVPGTATITVFFWDGIFYLPVISLDPVSIFVTPTLSCGPGTIEVNGVCQCEQQNTQCVGGVIIDIDTVSLLAGTIGIDPLLTGLIGITIGGLAVQAVWFVHRRKKKLV